MLPIPVRNITNDSIFRIFAGGGGGGHLSLLHRPSYSLDRLTHGQTADLIYLQAAKLTTWTDCWYKNLVTSIGYIQKYYKFHTGVIKSDISLEANFFYPLI